jgi:hypothetical protein
MVCLKLGFVCNKKNWNFNQVADSKSIQKLLYNLRSSAGVANSFCLAGQIGNTFGLLRPVTWGLKLSINSGENEFFCFSICKKAENLHDLAN